MVKNRNWQCRVEEVSKQRKEKSASKKKAEDKKLFKGWVQTLLSELDQHQDCLEQQQCQIHIWTQNMPKLRSSNGKDRDSSPPLLLDLLEDAVGSPGKQRGGGGRARSASIESEGSAASLKRKKQQARYGRARSSSIESEGSTSSRKSNKKKHQQAIIGDSSFSSLNSSNSNLLMHSNPSPILLCRHHFLYGTCDGRSGGKRGGACKYFHYSKSSSKHASLACILQGEQSRARNNSATLSLQRQIDTAVRTATPAELQETDPGAMPMLFYSFYRCDTDQTGTHLNTNRISDQIMARLAHTETPLASVVYVAVGGTLIFDRNQQGGVLQEALGDLMQEYLLLTRRQRPRQSSIESMTSQTASISEEELDADPTHFPGTILEHILTFLPALSVGACSQVCRAWNCEIGQHSPNLWLHLLRRQGWEQKENGHGDGTLTSDASLSTEATTSDSLKRLYQNHYVAIRDSRALASAVPPILTNKQALHAMVDSREATYESFASRKHAPQENDVCVALEEWSPNHVIAGYANECKLRLFKAVPLHGHEKRCKELVCQSVDPYKATKKRTCTLDAVALDEETIGCLCHVSSNNLHRGISAFLLVVLSREDFLMSENSAVAAKSGVCESADLHVIDIGEAVLNYILSSDHVDHRLLPLFDFLSDGGAIGDVCVTVSRQNIESCGHGRYMVEVSISIPNDTIQDDEVEDHDTLMIHLDRKLILFSANVGAIVWMGESYASTDLPPAHAIPSVLASSRRPRRAAGKRAQVIQSVVVGSILSPSLLVCDLEPSGLVRPARVVENSAVIRSSLQEGLQAYPSRCLLVTPGYIIAKDSVFRNNDDGDVCQVKSCLSFFSRFPKEGEKSHAVLHLSGHVRVHDFICMRDDYLVALCTELVEESSYVTSADDVEDPAEDVIDGQWFAAPQNSNDSREGTLSAAERHTIIVVHIPSRQEIGRVPFDGTSGCSYESLKPRLIRSPAGTVAMALGGYGLVMTGEDVRDLSMPEFRIFGDIHEDSSPRSNKKKKTGRAKNKNGSRKDRFTRGLSMRG